MRISEIEQPKWSRATIGDDVLVWIDTEKVRASWERDRYSYFDSNLHANAIKGRLPRFDEWVRQGEPIRAPELCLTDDDEVSFTNGRHRFVWMVQHGIRSMPVAVPPQYVDRVRERFGTQLTEGRDDSLGTVLKNPRAVQLTKFLAQSRDRRLRGLVDHSGDIYWWDAWLANHGHGAEQLGIDDYIDRRLVAYPDSYDVPVIDISEGMEKYLMPLARSVRNDSIDFTGWGGKWTAEEFLDQLSQAEPLTEMPMSKLNIHGDTALPGTFRPDDVKKITSTAWKDRVIRIFSKLDVDMELHILHGTHQRKQYNPQTGEFTPTDEHGFRVTSPHAFDTLYPLRDFKKYTGLQSREWGERVLQTSLDSSGVTVILTFNEGSDRVGLTPWMVAHRIAHAFFERNDREVNQVFDRMYRLAANEMAGLVGVCEDALHEDGQETPSDNADRIAHIAAIISPFRSARTHNIRDSGEYTIELMTQYLTSGGVRFNTEWTRNDRALTKIEQVRDSVDECFRLALEAAMGKVIVL